VGKQSRERRVRREANVRVKGRLPKVAVRVGVFVGRSGGKRGEEEGPPGAPEGTTLFRLRRGGENSFEG